MSVMMLIDIDDGNLINDCVLQLLVVQECLIVIKVMIEEGKSLLIVGFNFDSLNNIKLGILILLDVFFIGNLFKYINKIGQYMECFYLLILCILIVVSINLNDVFVVLILGVGMLVLGLIDWKLGLLFNMLVFNQLLVSVGVLFMLFVL